MPNSPDFAGIVRRTDHEERMLGVNDDQERDLARRHGMTFRPHYTSDGRDGHDDYECAAADRRALLSLLRETREGIEAEWYNGNVDAGAHDRLVARLADLGPS